VSGIQYQLEGDCKMAVKSIGRSSVSDMKKGPFFLFRRLLTSEMCHHVVDKEGTKL
jgi:hypothetical protein